MLFRDQVIADIPTFINVGEFGDTIEIDGVAMACVLIDDEAPTSNEGVSILESTLYTAAANFDVQPEVRQRLTVGGRQANVSRIDQEQGTLLIRLQWFES